MGMTDHAAIVREALRYVEADEPWQFHRGVAALDALVAEAQSAVRWEQLNAEWKKRVAAEAERDEARERGDAAVASAIANRDGRVAAEAERDEAQRELDKPVNWGRNELMRDLSAALARAEEAEAALESLRMTRLEGE